ncbi:helix-turn-helix domain-containing protein [Streptomyces sp. NPDC059785]|uniref:helix-turn-helix domain-containing protein n=1 Tax=Streptomyces sp. NPDC059785 TaxID=3346945 RepID=UPI003658F0EB
MTGSSPRHDVCRNCQQPFAQSTGPGRKREYCSTTCRQHAQRKRDGRAGKQRARSALPLGRRIAEDLQTLSAALLEAEYNDQPLEELLRCAVEVTREVECYTSAAIQDARNQGADWKRVAAAAQVSVTTARTQWAEAKVLKRLERRARERAAVRQPPAPGVQPRDAAQDRLLSQAAEPASAKLAAALSHLHRSSGLAIRDVAEQLSLSPSYVSRILSGERMPTWPVVCTLVKLFGGEPAELSALFESAHGLVPPAQPGIPHAVAQLQAALRGLHLAAGRPDPAVIHQISHGALSAQEINDFLSGVLIPNWEQASALVTALGGGPAEVRPLWEAVHYAFLFCLDPDPRQMPRERPASD